MTKKRIFRTSFIFGGLAGVLCFVFFLIMYLMVDNPLSMRRPDLGLNMIMIGTGIWFFKKESGGYLHFYEGVSVGFLINLFAALLTGILIFLFLHFVDMQPFTTWMAEGKQMLLNDRERSKEIMSEEMFQTMLKSFDNKNLSMIILDELIFKQISIVAITLFTMAMRKIKPN